MHYTLTVALPGDIAPEDLRTRLEMAVAKFDENLEVPLHRDTSNYAETYEVQLAKAKASNRDNWIEGLTDAEIVERWNGNAEFDVDGWPLVTINPEGYWDWWVVGGRWGGYWTLKEGASRGPIATENHAFGREPEADDDRRTDNARVGDVVPESIGATYSWLDLNGEWITRWIGPSAEQATGDWSLTKEDYATWEVNEDDHSKAFLKFIQDLPRDAWLVQVDFHN